MLKLMPGVIQWSFFAYIYKKTMVSYMKQKFRLKKEYKPYVIAVALFAGMLVMGKVASLMLELSLPVAAGAYSTDNWGLGFGAEGEKPTGNVSSEKLKEYNAYYVGDGEDKVIYLTYDAGFENGNTEAILDALKKHNVKATFFVVGHYLETAPELVKRMADEGHIVANHTFNHPDMSGITDKASFERELTEVECLYKEITGQDMVKFYRPPQGKYSETNLKMANEMGYKTFFWSLAYVDWYQDKQPTREEALSKLTKRIHPGAVVLLHNTSSTNAQIMDELLTKWEEMGYTFGTLNDLVN